MKSSNRTCRYGHLYIKSSDCPTCPICEQLRKPKTGFLSHFAAPARRALESRGIYTVEQLAQFNEREINEWHAIGRQAVRIMHRLLNQSGLEFSRSGK